MNSVLMAWQQNCRESAKPFSLPACRAAGVEASKSGGMMLRSRRLFADAAGIWLAGSFCRRRQTCMAAGWTCWSLVLIPIPAALRFVYDGRKACACRDVLR